MNKVSIKGIKFKLIGDIVEKGTKLSFKALNRENKVVNISEITGTKIISVFPDINTRICDMQTVKISQLAAKAPHINFISVSMDSVETINLWCANKLVNIDIWSDAEYKEFGKSTNTFISMIKKLARGFIVLNDRNEIIDIDFVKELSDMPNFDLIEKYI